MNSLVQKMVMLDKLPEMQRTTEFWRYPDARWPWYARVGLWLLEKAGVDLCFYAERDFARTVEIPPGEEILNSIMASKRDLRRIFGREATTLIVGREWRMRLLRMMDDCHTRHFSATVPCDMGFGDEFRVVGLRVVFCDWLEGWALLPDLEQA